MRTVFNALKYTMWTVVHDVQNDNGTSVQYVQKEQWTFLSRHLKSTIKHFQDIQKWQLPVCEFNDKQWELLSLRKKTHGIRQLHISSAECNFIGHEFSLPYLHMGGFS